MKRSNTSLSSAVLSLGALCTVLSTTGCQLDVNGQTLPSPYYLSDDIQYFPAGPEFKLSREAAAMGGAPFASTLPSGPLPAPLGPGAMPSAPAPGPGGPAPMGEGVPAAPAAPAAGGAVNPFGQQN